MGIKRHVFYLTTFFCLLFCSCFGQNAPLFVEGLYTPGVPVSGVSERQKSDLLQNSLTEIDIALKNENYNKAISISDSLIKEGFVDVKLYSMQSLAYEKLDDCDNAIYYASKAIFIAPSVVEPYITRANCYFKNKKIPLATKDIDTALTLNPKSERAKEVKDMIFNKAANINA